jgi:hypothetical protein
VEIEELMQTLTKKQANHMNALLVAELKAVRTQMVRLIKVVDMALKRESK